MEFQLSYFKSWKMMLWKCCTQYASKFGKCSRGHRTGKGQFSFQSQRKAMPKNVQTTTQLHSSHSNAKHVLLYILVGYLHKSRIPGLNTWIFCELLSSFKSWKMMLWKCCTQYASKFGKLSSGHRTGKGQFSFQSQRKAMPKNVQTTAQWHSSHMLAN